jgi:hypothetical protein
MLTPFSFILTLQGGMSNRLMVYILRWNFKKLSVIIEKHVRTTIYVLGVKNG